jgi:hypothetical protein
MDWRAKPKNYEVYGLMEKRDWLGLVDAILRPRLDPEKLLPSDS